VSDSCNNLLAEPVLRVREESGATSILSLASTFARLSRGHKIEFCALQAHQQYAWHAFMVQIAAIALHRESQSEPFESDDRWCDALIGLAGGTEAWSLVVPDVTRPAFLQPPVPEGSLEGFLIERYPDDLDVLVTAANHDVKRSRFRHASAEDWVYALVSLQTQQGYSGRFNFGIARMNTGIGNRPHVARAPGLGHAERFRRDLRACIGARAAAVEHLGYADEGGIALTWISPWAGKSSIGLEELDPWFVESCRRVRLVSEGGRFVAYRKGTDCRHVAYPESNGDTSDPWTPVKRAKGSALTISGAGFGYELTQQLLLGGQYTLGAAGESRPDDGIAPWFLAAAMARGKQPPSNGLHERLVYVPATVRPLLQTTGGRDRLRDRSERWVNLSKVAKQYVLSPALSALLGEGDGSKRLCARFLSAMDCAIDDAFFEKLWATSADENSVAEIAWARELVHLARETLATAIDTVPTRAADSYRVIANAENIFKGCARKRFPEAFAAAGGKAK